MPAKKTKPRLQTTAIAKPYAVQSSIARNLVLCVAVILFAQFFFARNVVCVPPLSFVWQRFRF